MNAYKYVYLTLYLKNLRNQNLKITKVYNSTVKLIILNFFSHLNKFT